MTGTSAAVIAIVGIDGSGKTTQALRLARTLAEAGVPVRYGPNPGGRRWLDRASARLAGRGAEGVLGRRGLLIVESVLRWLAIARSLVGARLTGRMAIMDRYTVCQLVSLRVHGAGRLLTRVVKAAYSLFPDPDLLILIDIAPETAHQRVEARGEDHEELSVLRKGGSAYRELAVGAVPVAGGMPEDEVAQAIWTAVRKQTQVTTG